MLRSVIAQTAKSPIIPANEIEIELKILFKFAIIVFNLQIFNYLKSKDAKSLATRAVFEAKTHFEPLRLKL